MKQVQIAKEGNEIAYLAIEWGEYQQAPILAGDTVIGYASDFLRDADGTIYATVPDTAPDQGYSLELSGIVGREGKVVSGRIQTVRAL